MTRYEIFTYINVMFKLMCSPQNSMTFYFTHRTQHFIPNARKETEVIDIKLLQFLL